MTSSRDALAAGNLAEAVALQTAVVEANPTDAKARLFLFELLVLSGKLKSAAYELERVVSDSPQWPAANRGFRRLLKAEYARTIRGRRPVYISQPPPHVRRRFRVARAVYQKDFDRAARWVDAADQASPQIAGHVDGREFEGLRDTDDRFGSVLEVFVKSAYLWIPFEHLRSLALKPAVGVLDAAFRPATITLANGKSSAAIVPMLYPGSHAADGEFATGQDTDWPDCGGLAIGLGSRVLMVGDEVVTLAECSMLEFRRAS